MDATPDRYPEAPAVAGDLARVLTVLARTDGTGADREGSGRSSGFLVRLAEREKLSTILTIDHDDFETYRIGSKTRFRIAPAR